MLYFDPTAVNFTTLCFIALAIWTSTVVSAQKIHHNLPLTFYGLMWLFNKWFDRGLSVNLLLAGVFLAMAVRFEFLNQSFTKWVSYAQAAVICTIIWNCLVVIFGQALMPQF